MEPEVGELLVGAYLKMIVGCQFIDYNVRVPGGGQDGLRELDVVGFDFNSKTAYLCEVTTHILGALYGSGTEETIERIIKKHEFQRSYAGLHLTDFPTLQFQFWSPYVPVGKITKALEGVPSLELVINQNYTARVNELRAKAREVSYDAGNSVFRTLQILEHLR
ncbi:hypothetical protein [Ferroacidibacillus organovorans]|uniref:Uncharacterized protein n=1 Tax=Ferroacidibacillus organovorans TaxID=1765683 RepID=A0A853KAN4_9BACL|nr:hypothetical protein [Ferroacidibacillus organovorans]KYP80110.1 hypothetical protein AYJ22_12295 [Ferroacidibacillus organovorans]OAG93178.1 hypothetical protein AYW79_11970 [Ferroacidibacillus organovorans]